MSAVLVGVVERDGRDVKNLDLNSFPTLFNVRRIALLYESLRRLPAMPKSLRVVIVLII